MKDKIHFFGRHINKNKKHYFSYSGSGFEFLVKPNNIDFSITLSLISELNEHDSQYVSIFINDEFYSKEKLINGQNDIEIKPNTLSKTKIKLIKVNEVYLSSIYLNYIELNRAELINYETEPKKKIGFFGDSLTCGYGLLDFHGKNFSMESEDFTYSYAYLTSKALDLDYVVIARSGISIALPIYCNTLFNEIYDTVDMFDKCEVKDNLDYAVINLGTNDSAAFNKSQNKTSSLKIFKEKYIELIERIIKDNPDVKLVLCYKMVEINEEIIKAIKEVYLSIKEKFSNKFELVEFAPDQNGASSHPYKTAHEQFALKLSKIITNL